MGLWARVSIAVLLGMFMVEGQQIGLICTGLFVTMAIDGVGELVKHAFLVLASCSYHYEVTREIVILQWRICSVPRIGVEVVDSNKRMRHLFANGCIDILSSTGHR